MVSSRPSRLRGLCQAAVSGGALFVTPSLTYVVSAFRRTVSLSPGPFGGAQYFVDEEGRGRERLGCEPLAAPELPGRAVSLQRGLSEHVHAFVLQIHEPCFLDAGASIKPDLDVAIVSQGRIRDFNHEDNITGPRMRGSVEVGLVSQY